MLGFFIAVPLYTFLYLKLEAKEGWVLSLGLTLGTFIFFVGLFDQIIHLSWHTPLVPQPDELIRSLIPQFAVFDSNAD